MNMELVPIIYKITNSQCDSSLLHDIAMIENKIQPYDSWDENTLSSMLTQDIYECWVLLNPNLLDSSLSKCFHIMNINDKPQHVKSCKVTAYCIISKIFEVAEILRIGTHPDFQRNGYAERLLNLIIYDMPNKGLEKILLEVREDNTKAIALYNKKGFEVINIREDYYQTSDLTYKNNETHAIKSCNALIMQYQLPSYSKK